jgi:hypothetical protein
VLLCWAVFIWACGRGYEFSDEAFDLILISDPFSYHGLSNFAHLWYPLYLALNGDIALFRITGTVILALCGGLFGLVISRFIDERQGVTSARVVTVLGVGVCIFWQHQTWDPTPDYNMLNLCAVLLFFSGLLESTRAAKKFGALSGFFWNMLGPAILCAVGISLMALTKATTAVLAVLFGLAWVVLLRPSRPLSWIILTTVLATFLVGVAMIATDGGIVTFIDIKIQFLRSPGTNGQAHGIATSVFGPFLKEWWKVAEALSFAMILFVLGLGWSYLLTSEGVVARWRGAAHVIAVALAGILLWWRVQDLHVAQSFMGFRVWRLTLALVLIAFALRILWLINFHIDETRQRLLSAAAILTVAPAAYSFGTGNLLIWHVAGAGIFWAAAMMVLADLAPLSRREELRRAIAFLCGVMSVGLLLSVMITPARLGSPLWEETVPVAMGAKGSRLAISPAAATYFETLQGAARENGFSIGTPTIDLSEKGLGLVFALGGKPLGALPWLISDGALPEESERREMITLQAADLPRQLAAVPVSELRRAWVITGAPAYFEIMRSALMARGLNFPDGYRVVSRTSRRDIGWTQVLWKPLDDAPSDRQKR